MKEIDDDTIVKFLESLDGDLQIVEHDEGKTYICTLGPIEDCEACQ